MTMVQKEGTVEERPGKGCLRCTLEIFKLMGSVANETGRKVENAILGASLFSNFNLYVCGSFVPTYVCVPCTCLVPSEATDGFVSHQQQTLTTEPSLPPHCET